MLLHDPHRPTARGEGHHYSSISEAKLAYDTRVLDLQAEVNIRSEDGTSLKTSIGRILFNEVLPAELQFKNQLMDRKALRQLVSECHLLLGNVTTAAVVDQIKNIGFRFATQSGTTIAMNDLEVPIPKDEILSQPSKSSRRSRRSSSAASSLKRSATPTPSRSGRKLATTWLRSCRNTWTPLARFT